MAKRNKKGSVAVHNRNGMLRLRWRYAGREFSLAMGLPDTQINRAGAEKLAATIQIDIALGEFDHSLVRYRPQLPSMATNTLELFDEFIAYKKSQGIQKQTIYCHYLSLKPYLESIKQPVISAKQAEKVVAAIRKRRKPQGANHALFLLRSFGNWAIEQGHWSFNPFVDIKTLKVKREPIYLKRKPFTQEEVVRILDAFSSTVKLQHYYLFTLCLFALGLRPSECIGLRWKYVDLERKLITVAESLVRVTGDEPLRKGTKNDVIRQLGIIDPVVQLLKEHRPHNVDPDSLVFSSKRGRHIDLSNYRFNYWRIGLIKAEVPYRPPYTARHTFASWGIEQQGWTLVQAAAMAGNSVQVMASTYAHMVNRPPMPEIDGL